MPTSDFRSLMPAGADAAFAWHSRPGAFERLNPPWAPARVRSARGGIEPGGQLVLSVPLAGPLRITWVALHGEYRHGRLFTDTQVAGPFASFAHAHGFVPVSAHESVMHDRIQWQAPGGPVGRRLLAGSISRDLARLFAFRHRTLRGDLAAHAHWRNRPPLRVAISGASGLVGRALAAFLSTGGHSVERLERAGRPGTTDPVLAAWPARAWDVSSGRVQWGSGGEGGVGGVGGSSPDAIVHFAGAGVAQRRWTSAYKTLIRSSRVDATRALCQHVASLKASSRPRVLVCASAIGVYDKSLGDRAVDEQGPKSDSFLGEVCREWEAATRPAAEAGIRVVHLRFGVVLSPKGGALAVMLPMFRVGLGGPLGSGRQWLSWVSLDDALDATLLALQDPGLSGPVNVVAPNPVRQVDFARMLGATLARPALVPAPAWALRAGVGGLADAELLAGVRVVPGRLAASGFAFRYPYLDAALAHMLGCDARLER